jgi:hypothetical protein
MDPTSAAQGKGLKDFLQTKKSVVSEADEE